MKVEYKGHKILRGLDGVDMRHLRPAAIITGKHEEKQLIDKVIAKSGYVGCVFDDDDGVHGIVTLDGKAVQGRKSVGNMSDEMVLAMCVGGFLGFGLGMMLFALVMRPADEAGRKSDAERIRRLEGEMQATSAKYREMANMMAYWRSRCIAYEKMLVERSRKAGAEK